MKSNWFLSVGCFAAGVVVGSVLWWRGERTVHLPVSEQGALPAQVAPERPRNAAFPRAMPDRSERETKVGVRLRALAELNGCLGNKISLPLLSFDELNADFLAVYDVTAAEKERMEAAVAKAQKEVANLETKFAVITPGPDGGFSISIPPFPEEGGAVYDELHRTVRSVLGAERYALYQTTGGEADSHSFGGCGIGETTINIRKPGTGNDMMGSWSSSGGLDGTVTKEVEIGRLAFVKQYPDLARKMADEGLWPMPVEP